MMHASVKKNLVAAGAALALLTGCGTAHAVPSKTILPPPAPAPILKAGPLTEKWSRGTCSFKDNRLTYKGPVSEKTIELDAKVVNPLKLICSDEYTVILTPEWAVVSLGGRKLITDQAELLWNFMGRFYPANMYPIGIKEIMSESIKEVSIKATNLVFQTKKREWTIDMAYPDEWKIINNGGLMKNW